MRRNDCVEVPTRLIGFAVCWRFSFGCYFTIIITSGRINFGRYRVIRRYLLVLILLKSISQEMLEILESHAKNKKKKKRKYTV